MNGSNETWFRMNGFRWGKWENVSGIGRINAEGVFCGKIRKCGFVLDTSGSDPNLNGNQWNSMQIRIVKRA